MAIHLQVEHPEQQELERLLAETRHGGREVPRARGVYTNRNLRMENVAAIGFDMDYTLAIYHKRQIEELSFEMTLASLVNERGYSPDIGAIRYDPAFVIRGLVVDKEHGNIFKMDRHKHVGRVYHGRRLLTKLERRALYRNEKIQLSQPRYAWIDTLFALPEACLFAEIIELTEGRGEDVDYPKLFLDIRECIDAVHRDGSLKTEIKKDLAKFIMRDADLGACLHKLRSGGKKLFLLTNSFWDYTDSVMKYLLDGVLHEYPSWQQYFDLIIVGASKPAWFSEGTPFLEVAPDGNLLGEARVLDRGKIYQGGNLAEFERLSHFGGERVLYVGDHIYGDIIRNRKASLWRTAMVIQELEDEIAYLERFGAEMHKVRDLEVIRARLDGEVNRHKLLLNELDRQIAQGTAAPFEEQRRREKADLEKLRRALKEVIRLIAELEDHIENGFNPYWGLVFKEGNENSRFGEQVEEYACIYTSRASNFLYYSPMQYFRSPRDQMAHERQL